MLAYYYPEKDRSFQFVLSQKLQKEEVIEKLTLLQFPLMNTNSSAGLDGAIE